MSEETSQKQERTNGGISVRFAAIITVVAVVGAFGLGTVFGSQHVGAQGLPASVFKGFATASPPEDVDLTPLWHAWETINERYVPTGVAAATTTEPVTDEEKVWGMIQGLAASLGDPYTVFLPPVDAEMFQADISGSFEGVGMEIAIRDQVLTVVSPLRDTPAARAGLMAGDRIIEIDGESTRDMHLQEAVQRIRGPRGSEVVLTIVREGENDTREIAVERDVIQIPTLERSTVNAATGEQTEGESGTPEDIYVIELRSFSAPSAGLFQDALQDFVASGKDSLILDLRGNPGGYLQAAVEMASWFLPAGEVVVTEDYGENKDPVVHRSRGYELFTEDVNMVVLVDRGSASGSEILAEALRHYDVATLVGTRTFGKGSVQELIDITPDTALKVTVARWMTPSGGPIPDSGIEPDVEVPVTEEDIEAEEDPQMARAIEILRESM